MAGIGILIFALALVYAAITFVPIIFIGVNLILWFTIITDPVGSWPYLMITWHWLYPKIIPLVIIGSLLFLKNKDSHLLAKYVSANVEKREAIQYFLIFAVTPILAAVVLTPILAPLHLMVSSFVDGWTR